MKKIWVIIISCFAIVNTVYGQESIEKNGPWQNIYPNGKIKTQGQFQQGVPFGEFIHFFEDGKTKAMVNFSNSGTVTRSTTYYPSGNTMTTGKYINKLKDSIWNYYADSTDKLVSTENYILGKLEGESITYYPGKNQVAEIVPYKNGIKQGPLLKYFPDGSLMTRGNYKNGQLDGDFFLYYPDGKPQLTGTYCNGEQCGDWVYYDENGKKMKYEDFVNQSSKPIDVPDPDKENKAGQPF